MNSKNPVETLLAIDVPEFPCKERESFGWVEYSGNGKKNRAQKLLSEAGISVIRWFNSKDYDFPIHTHKEEIWLFLYKGEMEVVVLDEKGQEQERTALVEGDCIHISKNKIHKPIFLTDCWYIAISMPQCLDWPT